MVISNSLKDKSLGVNSPVSNERSRLARPTSSRSNREASSDPHRRLSLHSSRRHSFSTAASTGSESLDTEKRLIPSSAAGKTSDLCHQTISLRTKKYLLSRLLSNRKFTLSVLHPLSANVMNDIHYILKAHITPKAYFRQVDQTILRSLIKVGVISQRLLDKRLEVIKMRRIENLSRSFGLTYSDLVGVAEETPVESRDITRITATLCKLQEALSSLTEGQLSTNSINQMNAVFMELEKPQLWVQIFDKANSTPEQWQLVRNLRDSLQAIIAAKLL